MATSVFQEFLVHMDEMAPHFDVKLLTPQLLLQGVITSGEKAVIENSVTHLDRAVMLCLNILPPKTVELHKRFVKILRINNYNGLADFLESRLNQLDSSAPLSDQRRLFSGPPLSSSSSTGENKPSSTRSSPFAATVSKRLPTSLNSIFISHTSQRYDLEVRSLGNVPETTGILTVHVQQASMPYDFQENEYYDIYRGTKGLALLINNSNYMAETVNRTGSTVDAHNISILLEKLGYDVTAHTDRTAQEMQEDIANFVNRFRGNSDYNSCIVVVMSHGDLGKFIGIDGKCVDQEQFFETIAEDEALAGKAKLFFVQACRASNLQNIENSNDTETLLSIAKSELESKQALASKIPAGDDVFIFSSITPGYFSWRNKKQGSWFIQSICEEFSEHAHKPWADLTTLATRVMNKVRAQFKTKIIPMEDGRLCNPIQLPNMNCTFTKKFHFFPSVKRGK